jgi:hypothetical protein
MMPQFLRKLLRHDWSRALFFLIGAWFAVRLDRNGADRLFGSRLGRVQRPRQPQPVIVRTPRPVGCRCARWLRRCAVRQAPSRASIPMRTENPAPSCSATVTRCNNVGHGRPLAATSRCAAVQCRHLSMPLYKNGKDRRTRENKFHALSKASFGSNKWATSTAVRLGTEGTSCLPSLCRRLAAEYTVGKCGIGEHHWRNYRGADEQEDVAQGG